jgi:hypothetical protein
MNLKSIISADISELEKKYSEAISASKRTAEQMDEAFGKSPKIAPIDPEPAAKKIKKSNDVIKESIESVTSEIIESFGIDGDVANMLANEFVKLRMSTILMTGAIGGAVIGVGILAGAMTSAAAEIRTLSQLTGLSTDQVQKWQDAASAAGVKADVFTEAIRKLQDRAKDAARGNLEAAQSFRDLGVNAADAARNAGPAFDRLLDVLQQVPDAQTRMTIAQRVLGEVNDQTLAGILALTDAHGALRQEVEALGAAINKDEIEQLAAANRAWDLFATRVKNFAKNVAADVVLGISDVGGAVSDLTSSMTSFVRGITTGGTGLIGFADAQKAAATSIAKTTQSVQAQTSAIFALSQELAAIRIDAIEKGISGAMTQIAFNARNASEAVKSFQQRLKMDDEFYAAVGKQQQYKKNLEALNELVDPPQKRGGGGARAKQLSEFEQLQKRLQSINQDIQVFGNLTSKEFQIKMRLLEAEDFRQTLEHILRMRRELGEPIRVAFPSTAEQAEAEIRRLENLKSIRDALAKPIDIQRSLEIGAEAQAQERARVLESFRGVQEAMRAETLSPAENAGAEVGEHFAEAMAAAIREGRTDIVDAINFLVAQARQRAEQAQALEQARTTTDVALAGLELGRVKIQNQVNEGILSEIEARQRQIEVESRHKDAILQALQNEQLLAMARGDAAEAARLAVEIERASNLGVATNERLKRFQETLGQGMDDIIGTLLRGGEGLREAGMRVINDIFNSLIQEMLLQATGGKHGSFGSIIGSAIGSLFGGIFGGGRAAGGPVQAGVPYMVGENGPEMFVPRSSGYIANRSQMGLAGESTVINAPITFQITTPDGRVSRETQTQIAARTASALTIAQRRNR